MPAGLIAKIIDGKLRNPDKNIIIIANLPCGEARIFQQAENGCGR